MKVNWSIVYKAVVMHDLQEHSLWSSNTNNDLLAIGNLECGGYLAQAPPLSLTENHITSIVVKRPPSGFTLFFLVLVDVHLEALKAGRPPVALTLAKVGSVWTYFLTPNVHFTASQARHTRRLPSH